MKWAMSGEFSKKLHIAANVGEGSVVVRCQQIDLICGVGFQRIS
jgi:hypothetical protein